MDVCQQMVQPGDESEADNNGGGEGEMVRIRLEAAPLLRGLPSAGRAAGDEDDDDTVVRLRFLAVVFVVVEAGAGRAC